VHDFGWRSASVDFGPLRRRSGIDLLDALRLTELPSLAIPADFGGGGAELYDVASAQRELAKLDPAAAIAFNMHALSIVLMVEHWRHERDNSWMLLEAIAEGRQLVGSAFAEPGVRGPSFLSTSSTATWAESGNGYILNGTKFPCSLATTSNLLCVNATIESSGEVLIALCPTASPGISVGDAWRSRGMTGSDTRRVVLKDVFVDERLVFYRAPATETPPIVAAGVVSFCILTAATYHGVLSMLLDEVLGVDSAVTLPPTTSRAVAAAVAGVVNLGLAIQRLAAAWDTCPQRRGDDPLLGSALALRLRLSEVSDSVSVAAREVVGGRAYSLDDPVARLIADVAAAHHHPPSHDMCVSGLVAAAAGRTIELERLT
jgi:alkylation response protein AidB-like acyl-CoA dehydrogenase